MDVQIHVLCSLYAFFHYRLLLFPAYRVPAFPSVSRKDIIQQALVKHRCGHCKGSRQGGHARRTRLSPYLLLPYTYGESGGTGVAKANVWQRLQHWAQWVLLLTLLVLALMLLTVRIRLLPLLVLKVHVLLLLPLLLLHLPLLVPVLLLLLPNVADLLRLKLLPILIMRRGELDLLVLLGGKESGVEGSRTRAERQLLLLVLRELQVSNALPRLGVTLPSILLLLLSLLWLQLVKLGTIVLPHFILPSSGLRLVLLQFLHTLLRPTLLPLHQLRRHPVRRHTGDFSLLRLYLLDNSSLLVRLHKVSSSSISFPPIHAPLYFLSLLSLIRLVPFFPFEKRLQFCCWHGCRAGYKRGRQGGGKARRQGCRTPPRPVCSCPCHCHPRRPCHGSGEAGDGIGTRYEGGGARASGRRRRGRTVRTKGEGGHARHAKTAVLGGVRAAEGAILLATLTTCPSSAAVGVVSQHAIISTPSPCRLARQLLHPFSLHFSIPLPPPGPPLILAQFERTLLVTLAKSGSVVKCLEGGATGWEEG